VVLPRRRAGRAWSIRERRYLTRAELVRLLDEVPPKWRPLFEPPRRAAHPADRRACHHAASPPFSPRRRRRVRLSRPRRCRVRSGQPAPSCPRPCRRARRADRRRLSHPPTHVRLAAGASDPASGHGRSIWQPRHLAHVGPRTRAKATLRPTPAPRPKRERDQRRGWLPLIEGKQVRPPFLSARFAGASLGATGYPCRHETTSLAWRRQRRPSAPAPGSRPALLVGCGSEGRAWGARPVLKRGAASWRTSRIPRRSARLLRTVPCWGARSS
jgi:hypothetical protein